MSPIRSVSIGQALCGQWKRIVSMTSTEAVKFLLVDDIDENLSALEALLRRDGLELFKARSGREALELLLVHDFALALLDVQMPEMDGFELAELMRGTERTRSEEHTSELQSLMRISYAVFCLKKKNTHAYKSNQSDIHTSIT